MIQRRFIFLLMIIQFSSLVLSQEEAKTVIINNDTIQVKALPLTDISNSTEIAYKSIKSIRAQIESYHDQHIIDSLTNLGKVNINKRYNEVKESLKSMSSRELTDEERSWGKVREILQSWQEKFNERGIEVEKLRKKTDLMKQQWILTLEEAKQDDAVKELKNIIETTLQDVTKLNDEVRDKQNQLYLNQSNITSFILKVDEVLSLINQENSAIRKSYFKTDAPPIWQLNDTTNINVATRSHFKKNLNEITGNLYLFLSDNKNKITIQSLVFILLLIVFLLIKQSTRKVISNENNFNVAKKVLSNFFISALIFTLFTSVWFYPIQPIIVGDILRTTVIFLSFFIFPLLFDKRSIYYILAGTISLILLNEVLFIVDEKSLFSRLTIYIVAILSITMLLLFYKYSKKSQQVLKLNYWQFIYYTIPVFIFLLISSIIGNTFGFVDLSNLLLSTTIISVLNAVALLVTSVIINSFIILLFETKLFQRSYIIRDHKNKLTNQITSIITLFLIAFWIQTIIKNFGFKQSFWEWMNNILEMSWSLGATTISLRSILAVIIVIVITVFVLKIVSALLNEELFPRIHLPRGVPGAISMIFRYTIVGFGFYFVLSAAGIDLGKFGLIAGALGVGIGFGLQNIVFNFIAGLVLAFERPIQVGDVIEIGTLMGTVSSIGVRSSNVRTFDGSEVIVPNGNLISKEVINWTLSDRKKRREIQVGVAYGSDPHQVIEILLKAANDHINVLETPAPWATFEGFGDSSLNFKIRFWVPFDIGLTSKSDIAISIYDALEEAGINIPFPQQDIYIKSIDKDYKDVTEQKFNTPGFEKDHPNEKNDSKKNEI